MHKNILVVILSFVLVGAIFISAGQKAEATFDFPDINICVIFPLACITPTVTPSIDVSPSVEVSPSVDPSQDPTPTPCLIQDGEFFVPCPTETPTATPTATVTPTTTPPPSDHGDGLSDGRESGHANAPKAPPATGRG